MSNRTRRKSLCRCCRSGLHGECQNPGGCKCPKCLKTRKREAIAQALWDRQIEAELRAEEGMFEKEELERDVFESSTGNPINFDALRQAVDPRDLEKVDDEDEDLDEEDDDWDEEEKDEEEEDREDNPF